MRGGMEHFFLRPRAGEKERYAAKRHHADRVGRERHRHQFPQAAHFPDVLFVMRRVNDRAGAEEQERFEKSVGEEVHDAGRDAAHAERYHHQAQLRDGGVSQDAFDVCLGDRNQRRHQRCDNADPDHDGERRRDAIDRA